MTSKQGITSPRAPTALAKTLNLGKWKKDANEGRSHPCEEYEVIGQGGSRDGVLLSRGEPFQRSWTILNSAVFANKAKSRVAKLIQTKGPPLKESLLFLWPPPGKCVEVGTTPVDMTRLVLLTRWQQNYRSRWNYRPPMKRVGLKPRGKFSLYYSSTFQSTPSHQSNDEL